MHITLLPRAFGDTNDKIYIMIDQNLLTQVYFYCHMIQVKDSTLSPSISNGVIDVTSVHAYFAASFNLIAAAVEQCVCCYRVTWRGGNVRNCFISQIRVEILKRRLHKLQWLRFDTIHLR